MIVCLWSDYKYIGVSTKKKVILLSVENAFKKVKTCQLITLCITLKYCVYNVWANHFFMFFFYIKIYKLSDYIR